MRGEEGRFLKGIGQNILLLGLISLFNDASSEAILAILPLFLTAVLGAQMVFVGLIEGMAEGAASALKITSGWFSDRLARRRPFVIIGYGVSNFSKFLLFFASIWQHVLLIRFSDRVGKGLRTASRDALIAEASEVGTRGKAYGLHRMMDTFGAIVGPLLSFFVLTFLLAGEAGFRLLFLLAAIPGFMAFFITFLIRESKGSLGVKGKKVDPELQHTGGALWAFFAVATIFALGNFSYAFLILRAEDFNIARTTIPLLYALSNIVYAMVAMPVGALSDRVDKRSLIVLGYAIFGGICVGFSRSGPPLLAVALFIAYGVFNAINEVIQRAYVSILAPLRRAGGAFGTFHALIGLVALPSSIIAGFLWDAYSATTTFSFGASLSFLAAFLLMALKKRLF